jgi:transcription elongation factor Elf1
MNGHCEHIKATVTEVSRKGSVHVACGRCGLSMTFGHDRDKWPQWLKSLVGVKH